MFRLFLFSVMLLFSTATAGGQDSNISKKTIDEHIKSLETKDSMARLVVVYRLKEIGAPAVPALTKAVHSDDEFVQQAAIIALGMMGSDARIAVPVLIDELKNENNRFRHDIVASIRDIEPDAAVVTPALIEALRVADIRDSASYTLAGFGESIVPELIGSLEDFESDPDTTVGLVQTLGRIGNNASAAVPKMAQFVHDSNVDMRVRIAAANALGEIGPASREAIPLMFATLQVSHDDAAFRCLLIEALGQIGHDAHIALQEILSAISDDSLQFECRQKAVIALGKIGPHAFDSLVEILNNTDNFPAIRAAACDSLDRFGGRAVPPLAAVLKSDNDHIRLHAITSLGNIGAEAKTALPDLEFSLRDKFRNVRHSACHSIALISKRIVDQIGDVPTSELDALIIRFENLLPQLPRASDQNDVRRSLAALEDERRSRTWADLARSIYPMIYSKWMILPAFYLLLFLLCVMSTLFFPSAILRANESLYALPEVTLGKSFVWTRSVRHLLLVGFFNHYRRVLDCWVKQHASAALRNFSHLPTVKDRSVIVKLPVNVDGQPVNDFFADSLQSAFRQKDRICVLIVGQGGAGKTSLACQLGMWSVADDRSQRLCRHLMIPVLIEDEIGPEGLLEKARGELQRIIGSTAPVDPAFFNHLLRKKRVLIMIDHLSEMSNQTRTMVRPKEADFPVAALVITSRIDEDHLGITNTLQPVLLRGNRVSAFVEQYLSLINKSHIIEDDEEYFAFCVRLRQMAGDRQITPLLAKLFVDDLVQSRALGDFSLPANIPDLMLRYLDRLHPPGTSPDIVLQVRKDIKVVAWSCLKQDFHVVPADRDALFAMFDGDNIGERIDYLENHMRVLRRDLGNTSFLLDPLAEYLAAIEVVEIYKGNSRHWRLLFERLDEKPAENARAFILAVRDCCNAMNHIAIPDFVLPELERRCGLDQELLEKSRRKERVERFIRDLDLPDVRDRRHAAHELGEMGPHARRAVSALCDRLDDGDDQVQEEAIRALGMISPQGKSIVPRLIPNVKSKNERIVLTTLFALAQFRDEAADAVPELLKLFRDGNTSSHIRQNIAITLGCIGPKAKATIQDLAMTFSDEFEDGKLRGACAKALGGMWPESRMEFPVLVDHLKDDDWDVSKGAVSAVGIIGGDARACLPTIVELINDQNGDMDVRREAVIASASIDPIQSCPVLISNLNDYYLTEVAMETLASLGEVAVPFLNSGLENTSFDSSHRANIAQVLERIGPDAAKAVPSLLEVIQKSPTNPADDEFEYIVREVAIDALARIGCHDPSVVSTLAAVLLDEGEVTNVRYSAARAISSFKVIGNEICQILVKALQSSDSSVRAESARRLPKLGAHAMAALPDLENAKNDADSNVRAVVRESIEIIGRMSRSDSLEAHLPC